MSNDVLRKQIGKFTRCFSVLLKNCNFVMSPIQFDVKLKEYGKLC